jgi:L-lactate dehydrogenase (cytochrome)
MLALGADAVLLGRLVLYALATKGEAGVTQVLKIVENEMRVAMTLTGARTIKDISRDSLASFPV